MVIAATPPFSRCRAVLNLVLPSSFDPLPSSRSPPLPNQSTLQWSGPGPMTQPDRWALTRTRTRKVRGFRLLPTFDVPGPMPNNRAHPLPRPTIRRPFPTRHLCGLRFARVLEAAQGGHQQQPARPGCRDRDRARVRRGRRRPNRCQPQVGHLKTCLSQR